MSMAKRVEICECGHTKTSHAKDHKGIRVYCKEYIYNNFDFKCRCQMFTSYMVLDDEDVGTITSEDDVLIETI